KTPWRPGLTPVMNVVQLGNVAAGMVEPSRPHAPSRSRRARCGSVPSAVHGSTRSSVAPSRPRINSMVRRAADGAAAVAGDARAHLLELREHLADAVALARRQIRALLRIVGEVEQLHRWQSARVVAVGGDQLPIAGVNRYEAVTFQVFLGEDR